MDSSSRLRDIAGRLRALHGSFRNDPTADDLAVLATAGELLAEAIKGGAFGGCPRLLNAVAMAAGPVTGQSCWPKALRREPGGSAARMWRESPDVRRWAAACLALATEADLEPPEWLVASLQGDEGNKGFALWFAWNEALLWVAQLLDTQAEATPEQTAALNGEPPKLEASHASDFRSVSWFGQTYSFTPNQAAVIRELWTAWENDTPEVGGQTLLEKAGSAQTRLPPVFNSGSKHPAWNTMIRPGTTKGTYRLCKPEETG